MRRERVKSVDGEEQGAEKKGARRGEEGSHLFLQKEGAQRHTWSSLPPAAGSQERAGERQWSRGEGTQSECCLSPYAHLVPAGTPRPPHCNPQVTATLRHSTESLRSPLPTTKRGADLATKGTFHRRSSDAEISRAEFSKGDWTTPGPQLSWESQSLRTWEEPPDQRADGTTKAPLGSCCPRSTQQGVVHPPCNCSLKPPSSSTLCPSPGAFPFQGISHLLCFANGGRTFAFLEMFECQLIPRVSKHY